MNITSGLFEAFLNCPTKCFLQSRGEAGAGNAYPRWVRTQNESYRTAGVERLMEGVTPEQCLAGPDPVNLRAARWNLAVDVLAQARNLESCLHAVERVPSLGQGQAAQFIPIRFVFTHKLTRNDRRLLAFDTLALSEMLGREVRLGHIIHGDDHARLKVKTLALAGEVRKLTATIAALLSSSAPPDLVLNRHCAECDFQLRCRQAAMEKDDLSLLAHMTAKERKKYHRKGIFTATQLSYTFRPRRRPKRMWDKPEKYHHALKALAIREKKIHIVGSPELKIDGTPVYLDVEALPDRDFYYLIGARTKSSEGGAQHSFWADSPADERRIWTEFLDLLMRIDNPVLIHYGSFEAVFLREMCRRHGGPHNGSAAAKAVTSSLNLLSVIYGRVYFPTFSNGLKEIARYLGFEWSERWASGVQTIESRERWSDHRERSERQRLIRYNSEDCEALSLVTQKVLDLHQARPKSHVAGGDDVVDTTTLKREHPYGFKTNTFFLPAFDTINKAAYWDYQRERVYVKSARRFHRVLKRTARAARTLPPNKRIQCPAPVHCQRCGSPRISTHGRAKRTKIVFDVKFTRGGVKRWIVHHQFQRYQCRDCQKTFFPLRPRSGRWGRGLLAYSVYQNIELRLAAEMVDRNLNATFRLRVPGGSTGRFRRRAAGLYVVTYEALLKRLQTGWLIHVDETRAGVRGKDGYVWVLANLEEVAYVYAESRESDWIQTFLKDFRGVLVTDFYAGYDGVQCPKQRCLIHLLRDLNDDLYKHPYNEEVKRIGRAFSDLVRPMIETIDRYGLKARFLGKHLVSVDRFYRELACAGFGSEPAVKWKQRLGRDRDELFTFLRYNGVPWNNNNAEHAVKAFAQLRRVITGLTTEQGLRSYLILLSICETCKYRGVDFLDFLRSGERDIDAFVERRLRGFRGRALNDPAADRPARPEPIYSQASSGANSTEVPSESRGVPATTGHAGLAHQH